MSTGKVNIQAQRFALLARMDEKLFHTSDLANLWLIKNKNTLYTTLKRYCSAGLLYRLFKGLYSLLPPDNLDPILLGTKILHTYCYLSAESILYREGYVSKRPGSFTFISSKSDTFKVGDCLYKSRKANNRFLFNPVGINNMDGIRVASVERAIADMLYFMPKFHFDRPIDWTKIREIQKTIGYPLTSKRYGFTKSR